MEFSDTRCVSDIGYLAHWISKGETIFLRKLQNNSKRWVIILEEKNAGTKREKCQNKGLTRANDLSLKQTEGTTQSIGQTEIINLT